MKTSHLIIAWIVSLLFATPVFSEVKEKLTLKKGPDLGGIGSIMDSCDGLYPVKGGVDVADLRGFRYYFCDGMYSIILEGPPGKTVTLYGNFKFDKSKGYLIVRKKDDQQVWIEEIEQFSPGTWSQIPASSESGAFAVYYHGAPRFKSSIGSVKWGKWWEGPHPK